MRKYLREKREKLKLTQTDVAEKLCIGESYYCMIENGERKKKLDIELAVKLSEILDVDVSWIIEQEKKLMCEIA